ncbi:MAG: hypothetical protein PHE30_02215 [Candidatus Omnitrophica bacterium]|nr:hypothetical protein [Candidatus Omnitrophota bacterium]MDD5027608.1 hypothetical protein [Candidatus Omnitrophota bacterium]MDD5662482.1 hypothetical protein [Candidatus Omnitrophota bacterium]
MILIEIIGIFIIAMGSIILLNPKAARKMLVFWRKGNNIFLAGLIRIVIGIIFLGFAPRAKVPQVIFVLGILALLGGLLIFILGPEKVRTMLGWWDKKPDNLLRLISLVTLTFGILLIYAA